MCEFCANPPGKNTDAQHVDFAGFFTPDAIEAAVQQAKAERATQRQERRRRRRRRGGGNNAGNNNDDDNDVEDGVVEGGDDTDGT